MHTKTQTKPQPRQAFIIVPRRKDATHAYGRHGLIDISDLPKGIVPEGSLLLRTKHA